MTPAALRAKDFDSYPPQARRLTVENLHTLQQIPLAYLVIVLRELATYDWKLPAERERVSQQLKYLGTLPPDELAVQMRQFAALDVSKSIEHENWVAAPSATLEKMTAVLWSTHQMDAFRHAAEDYSKALSANVPERMPSQPRLGMVVIGQGVTSAEVPLFRKLRPHGVHLRRIKETDGLAVLQVEAQRRAQSAAATAGASDASFQHWYIDGGAASPATGLTQVSYSALEPARQALLRRTQQAIASGDMGPERLRTMLANLKPEDIGLGSSGQPEEQARVLNYFQLSLLTEGSGTQIFSTTFVQWTARECLRRAEPETVLLRYAPRQKQQSMNTMLSGQSDVASDPVGSIIDADMGAYYTWLNMRRLSGASQMRFLVYFEQHNELLAIGPGLPGGTTSDTEMDMRGVLKMLA
jgi:hypothetical protein